MFSLYLIHTHNRSKNSEDECIYPESQKHSKSAILAEIADICQTRCEYNQELVTFFGSSTISEAEKQERFSSLFPEIARREKIVHLKDGITQKMFEAFKKLCENDLNIFYTALKIIEKYKNNEYPDDFPIFFELSETFKLSLAELQTGDDYKAKIIKYSGKTSEEAFFRHCIKKLQLHVESDIKMSFESFFEMNATAKRTGYKCKNEKQYRAFMGGSEQNALFLSYVEQYPDLANPSPDAVQDSLSKSISECFKKIFSLELEHLEYVENYGQCANELNHLPNNKQAIYITSLARHFFYQFHSITEIKKKQFTRLKRLLEEFETGVLSPVQPLNPVKQNASSYVKAFEEEKTVAEDPCVAYATFKALKEKKLKQQHTRPRANAETKENLEPHHTTKIIARLVTYNLQETHIDTLEKIFQVPVPHNEIRWHDIKKLILKCGGSVDKDTGSSRRVIRLPDHKINTLIDIAQRGVHEPHKRDKNATISRWPVMIFRTAFERSGITPSIIQELRSRKALALGVRS